jgi:hypothetical protein
MDELDRNFGRLSTQASEWKPTTTTASASSLPESDLTAAAVKEFVPGRGWSAPPAAATDRAGELRILSLVEE